MYRAIVTFTDLQDGDYKYVPGDEYPRHGLQPSKDRIEELLTDKNRRHKPMIEEVKAEPAEKTAEQPTDAETEEVAQPKPKRKRAKKAPEVK